MWRHPARVILANSLSSYVYLFLYIVPIMCLRLCMWWCTPHRELTKIHKTENVYCALRASSRLSSSIQQQQQQQRDQLALLQMPHSSILQFFFTVYTPLLMGIWVCVCMWEYFVGIITLWRKCNIKCLISTHCGTQTEPNVCWCVKFV